jgi:hypothetical protein
VRADLEDDPADQGRVDLARRFDLAPRGLLDLLQQPPLVLVGELDGRGQLRGEDALILGDQALELLCDLLERADPALVREHEQEVAE